MRISEKKLTVKRRARKMSQSDLARAVGCHPQTIQSLEAGNTYKTGYLVAIARALGVEPEDLLEEDHTGSAAKHKPGGTTETFETLDLSKYASGTAVPIYGRAAVDSEGFFEFNGQEIGRVMAARNLTSVPDAYAIYVDGESMEPRFFAGELVFVNPHKPATSNCFVIVQISVGKDNTPLYATICQFIQKRSEEIVLKQLNPPEDVRIPLEKVVSVHRIVGSTED